MIKITVEFRPPGKSPRLIGVGTITGGPTDDDPSVGEYQVRFNDLSLERETSVAVRGFVRKRGIWDLVYEALATCVRRAKENG